MRWFELMYSDFLGRAGDEVFNQLPKWQAMSAGILRMPVVLRVFRRIKIRRAAFPGLDSALHAYPGFESCLPCHAL